MNARSDLCDRLGHNYTWPISQFADGRWLYICATCGHHAALPAPVGNG